MTFAILGTALLQGFVGSPHCLGMCGPFVFLLNSRDEAGIFSGLLYNFGRTISYSVVGFILGSIGWGANRFFLADFALYLGSALVLIIGLQYIFPIFPRLFQSHAPHWILRYATSALKNINNVPLLSFMMGTISGLLPCGILYPAYSLSLLTGDPLQGSLVMVVFSLGTYPMLLTLGLSGQKVMLFLQKKAFRVGIGIFLVIFAIYTIVNRIQLTEEEQIECHTEIKK
jgi:sulfite exporter TauE/SafE